MFTIPAGLTAGYYFNRYLSVMFKAWDLYFGAHRDAIQKFTNTMSFNGGNAKQVNVLEDTITDTLKELIGPVMDAAKITGAALTYGPILIKAGITAVEKMNKNIAAAKAAAGAANLRGFLEVLGGRPRRPRAGGLVA